MPDLGPGARVDRYVVEGKLGEGGMAVVYRVRHETLGTVHALKVMTLSGRKLRDRMVREGQVQARLEHENIVPVTDVLRVGKRPGLLMPFVAGPSLDSWLARYRPSLDESLTLFRGICAGVGAAHARGLVHRDLKPANVLLALTDGRIVPKVTDFGLAKDLERSGATGIGATIGTPGYMAPEQMLDASGVDRRADLWSLGCLLYRLVCGVDPFDGDDAQDLLRAVQSNDRVASRRLRPELPDRVHDAIDQMLVLDPDRRIADCDALVGYLDHRLDRLPLPAKPLGPATAPTTLLPRWLPDDGEGGLVAKAIAAETLKALPKLDRSAVDLTPSDWSRAGGPTTSESGRSGSSGPPGGIGAAFGELRPSERPTSLHRRQDLRQGGAAQAPTPISPPRNGPSTSAVSMSAVAPPRAAAPMGKLVLALSLAGAALIAAGLVGVGGVGMVMIVQGRAGLTPLEPLTEAGGPSLGNEPRIAPASPGSPPPAPAPDAGAPVPRKVRPQPTPADPPAPAPAGGAARVTFSGVDRLWLVRLDDPDAPPPDLGAVPPGRYRVFAEFPNVSGSSGAGEIDVGAGRRIHLTCVADFARCKPE